MSTGEPITIDRAHAVKLAEAIADLTLHILNRIPDDGDINVALHAADVYRAWHDCRNLPQIPTIGEREAALAWDEALDEET